MSTGKYDALDAGIVDAIAKRGRVETGEIHDANEAEIERLCGVTGRENFRILDGRLQSIRKAGKIRYQGGYWEIVK